MGVRGMQVISTTRAGGASTGRFAGLNVGGHVGDSDEIVQANRQMLCEQLPPGSTITWLNQVHGTRVIHAPSEYVKGIEADAVWTDEPGFACAVMTADCLPVILADVEGQCVAAAHCGWRGLAGDILKRTIEALLKRIQRSVPSLKLTTNTFSILTSLQGGSCWHWVLIPAMFPVETRVPTVSHHASTRIDATAKPAEWSR
jgi:copper oxidase (laccase) domain-containing protein